jgi:hypothetical protein
MAPLQLSCRNCSLLLDGVLVVDNWESAELPAGSTKVCVQAMQVSSASVAFVRPFVWLLVWPLHQVLSTCSINWCWYVQVLVHHA